MPDMTRLAHTLEVAALKFNQSILWIVSEDSTHLSPQVAGLLKRTSVPSVHLLGPRPLTHLDKRSGRGVSNRLKSLEWLRKTYTGTNQAGVIYFADDDNSYDARIFPEMETTVKVSVWPVGLIVKTGVSSPVINSSTGLVQGFHDPYIARRKFAVDMAGFAADLQLFLSNPKSTMPYKVGYEEDFFIRSLGVKITDLEPKANNCTEVCKSDYHQNLH
jgi:beta-1,3-glucuronyltransferase